MKKLVTVTSLEVIPLLKTGGITLLYPLRDFCVGYTQDFLMDEIDDFCLVNRILEDSDLDKLADILKQSKIKGIVFDDLGVLDVVKDMNITKILLLDHLATNVKSINYYLDYVDSVVLSNDLNQEEMEYILKNAKKPLVVNVFGLKSLMYSRRTLLSNYASFHKLPKETVKSLHINNKYFKAIENIYGTKFYAYPYYNGTVFLNKPNILFFWYDPILLDKDKVVELVIHDSIDNIPCTDNFLSQKTIFKVGDIDD